MANDVRNFEEEVIQRSYRIPVLVDFWAEWCAPCKILTPVLERLAQENEGRWALAKVNTEEMPDVASQYGIQSIPNVKLFFEGKMEGEFVGALPEYAVAQWLRNTVPSKHKTRITLARTLLDEQRHLEAEGLLGPILADEPGNEEVKALMAKAILYEKTEQARRLIDEVDDPRYHDIVEGLQTLARLIELHSRPDLLPDSSTKRSYGEAIAHTVSQNFERALALFIEIIRGDRYYDDDGARKACIAIFKFLGEEHPVTQKYRRDFSSALY